MQINDSKQRISTAAAPHQIDALQTRCCGHLMDG